MRRPARPFVTEYKSSTRRQKDVAETRGFSQPTPDAATDVARGWPDPGDDNYEAALRAADALFSRNPDPASRQAKDPEATGASAIAAEHQGGRVLRALDEEANPFAALEAEHAPKRRGRKPGSKNKPKPPAAVVDDTPTRVVPRAEGAEPPLAPVPVAARTALMAEPVRHVRTERFAWVRTSLRPGEKWKRRLPKVAW